MSDVIDEVNEVAWAFDPASEVWRDVGIRSLSEVAAWGQAGVIDPASAGRLRQLMGGAMRRDDRTATIDLAVELSDRSDHLSFDETVRKIGETGASTPREVYATLTAGPYVHGQLKHQWDTISDDLTLTCADMIWAYEARLLVVPRGVHMGWLKSPLSEDEKNLRNIAFVHALLGRLDPETYRLWMASRIGLNMESARLFAESGDLVEDHGYWMPWAKMQNEAYSSEAAQQAIVNGWWPIAAQGGKPAQSLAAWWPTGALVGLWGNTHHRGRFGRDPRTGVWAAAVNGVHPWKLSVIAERLRHGPRKRTWAAAYKIAVRLAETSAIPEVPCDAPLAAASLNIRPPSDDHAARLPGDERPEVRV